MNTIIQKMNNTIQKLKIDELMLKVIELVSKFPFEAFTVDKIRKSIRTTNYATMYRKIDYLVEQKILSKSMYGMASQIRINLQNENTISLLSLIETKKFEQFFIRLKGNLFTSINEIIKDTRMISEFKCVLIFGSYAKGAQTAKSDLDLLVIYEASSLIHKENYEHYVNEIKKSMRGIIKTSELRGGPTINPIIVSTEEHKEMILNKEHNVGKETLLNHVILKGYREYWEEIANVI